MTEQVEEVVATEEENAAFESGFTGEPVETPVAEQPAQEEDPAPEAEPVIERNQWGYTDDEMKNLLSKAARVDDVEQGLRKVYGKLGEYNGTIQQMQAANKGGNLTARQLNHLRGEFPELADLLEKDFGEAVATPTATESAPAPVFDASVIDQRVASATLEVKKELLSIQHPDWREVKDSTEFDAWTKSQPTEKQQMINESQSIPFVISTLNDFKKWQEQTQKAATKKTARLESAVAPTGVANSGPPAIDENEAFAAGWKTVRG